jgi:late competence protein required for DNA uptake (superfamily II DNA/RNA helicase)
MKTGRRAMSDETRPVKPVGASEVSEGHSCVRCGSKEDLLRYAYYEEHYYCRTCWERAELQQKMIEEDLEEEPSLE